MTRCDQCGQRIPELFGGADLQNRFAVAPSVGESAVNADPDARSACASPRVAGRDGHISEEPAASAHHTARADHAVGVTRPGEFLQIQLVAGVARDRRLFLEKPA